MTTTTTPTPDLDVDILTYRFKRHPRAGYNPKYSIERSINGGEHHRIGTVERIRESGWDRPAHWVAWTDDEKTRGSGDSRTDAVRSLEDNLQPEWAARSMAESQERSRVFYETKARIEVEAEVSVQVYDRSSWEEPEYLVVRDSFPVARFFIHPARFTAEQAERSAYDLARSLKSSIVSAALADMPSF